MASRLFHKHILSARQFTRSDLQQIFLMARELRAMPRQRRSEILRGLHAILLFCEPSSRTKTSFDSAMKSLGGTTSVIDGEEYSSMAKGESLEDTVRTFESYSDLIVLRHRVQGSAQAAARVLRKPLINAGDGIGEHPTQALLDLFTVDEELGDLDGLTITLLGDLKHGRTVHALAYLLSMYRVTIHLVSPAALRMPETLTDELRRCGIPYEEHTSLDPILPKTDVLYVTRVQTERETDPEKRQEMRRSCRAYDVTPERMALAKSRMVVMHPFPRNEEIARDVDADPRAAYFRQIENGLYVRMALLCLVLGAG